MSVQDLRAWAEARVERDADAGLVPAMTAEVADRVDVVLGDLSPWRTAPVSAEGWAGMTVPQRLGVLTSEALVHVTGGDPDARAALRHAEVA